jgi:cytoskeletal protein RodZ
MSGVRPSYDDRFAAPLEANRRGAHRARPNPVLGFLPIVAVMALVGIVAGGAFALLGGGSLLPGGNSPSGSVAGASPLPTTSAPRPSATATTPSATGSATATATAPATATATQPSGGGGTVTKTVKLTILNATKPAVNGLAAKVKVKLQGQGWTVAKTATQTSSSPPTTVYYATADLRATANALVKALGVGLVQQNPAQAGITGITIVIGNDYQR